MANSKNYFIGLALAVMFLFATNARADVLNIDGTNYKRENGVWYVDEGSFGDAGYTVSDVGKLFSVTIAGNSSNLYITNVYSDVLGVDVYKPYGEAGGSGNGQIMKNTNSSGQATSSFTNGALTVVLSEGNKNSNWHAAGTKVDYSYPYTLDVTALADWTYSGYGIVFSEFNHVENGKYSDFNGTNNLDTGWGNTTLTFTDWDTKFTTWAQDSGAFWIATDPADINRWLDFTISLYGTYQEYYDNTEVWFSNWVEIDYDPTANGDASTPEPATLAVLGLGLIGVGLAARRRNKR